MEEAPFDSYALFRAMVNAKCARRHLQCRFIASGIHDWHTGSTAFFSCDVQHAFRTRSRAPLFLTVNHIRNINSAACSMLQIKFNHPRDPRRGCGSLRQKLFSAGRLLLIVSRQFISGGVSALYGFNYAYFNPPRRHFLFRERGAEVERALLDCTRSI